MSVGGYLICFNKVKKYWFWYLRCQAVLTIRLNVRNGSVYINTKHFMLRYSTQVGLSAEIELFLGWNLIFSPRFHIVDGWLRMGIWAKISGSKLKIARSQRSDGLGWTTAA